MATMRLVPSAYTLSNTQYLTISNDSNMYTNTDSTTMATVQHTRASTTAYYLYIHGFNFSALPSNATVTGFTIKIRAYESGLSTSSSYRISLYNNTTSLSSTTASASLSTTAQTLTIPTGSYTWSQISGYGNNFRIRVPLRRNSSSTACYVYIYGAEIEVTYTVPVYHSVTINNSTAANVQASDTNPLEGEDVVISSDTIFGITVLDNDVDVTNQFVQTTGGTVAATADSFTTGYSTTGISFYTSSSSSGSNFNYAVGHTAESPGSTASGSGSWTYVKTSSGSTTGTGYADFVFDFSGIPAGATISSVQVKCYGAIEDTSQTTSHADITLYSGSTQKGTMQKFTSSTNSIITLSDVGTWTRDELQQAKLRFAVGYYGGHLFGITWTVTYQANGYVYTISEIATDHVIVVTNAGPQTTIYLKSDGSETFAGIVEISAKNFNTENSVDLSTFSAGDTCRIAGTVAVYSSGAPISETITDIGHSFTWTGNSYEYTVGIMTMLVTSTGITINTTYTHSGRSLYALPTSDKNIRFYKSSSSGWKPALAVYKNVSGSWVRQYDLTTVFTQGVNYIKR